MAATTKCLASLARLSLASATRPIASPVSSIPRFLAPSVTQIRCAGQMSLAEKRAKEKSNLKKKRRQQRFKEYKFAVPSGEGEQFSLCDAMRYIRAAEVGRPPSSVTYELALRVRTIKNSPPIRNRVRLPYPVKNDTRIAVICPDGSSAMNDARLGGAVAYGEESLFAMIKENPNNLPFNRLLCHLDSMQAMNKAGLGRILGPKGLMPSLKTGTVTKNIRGLLQDMVGTETYREKIGVVRMAIGNILFTPKQLSDNVKAFIDSIKDDIERMEDRVDKKIIEVVLSATNSPGFPLNGGFLPTDPKLDPVHLSTTM